MNLHRVWLLSLLLFTICASAVFADDVAVVSTTTEGVGVIKDGNKAVARDQAIRDGLRIAVEQAVGTMVASETLVQNYEVLRDQIYSKTQGYIKDYTLIDEKEEGTLYRVTLKAQVARENLENDLMALGLLMHRKEMPRIMLMVAEQNVGMHTYSFWWGLETEHTDLAVTETVLLEQLGQKGFVLVDPSVKAGQVDISQPYRISSLSNGSTQGQQLEGEREEKRRCPALGKKRKCNEIRGLSEFSSLLCDHHTLCTESGVFGEEFQTSLE